MKIKRGSTSVRRLFFVADSSSTTGAGLANLVYNSSGLAAYYMAGDLNAAVQITLASATLGTFTSGGFVAVDNTNMPGWYEIGIPNAALDGGNEVAIQLRGATNMSPVNIYIELCEIDYQTAVGTTVRTELNTELTRIDTAVSTRQAASTFAADTRTAVGLASANLDTQLSGLASDIDNINVDFTPVINTLSDIKGTGWTSTDSLKAISDSVDGLVTTGLNPNPLTVTVQSSGSPVAGVAVSVRSGNTVVAWGRTNVSGQVVFGLAAGSYSVLVLSSTYYQTPTPQNVTIPTASTLSIELTQQSISPPNMPGLCTVRFSVVHQGAFVSGAEVTAEIDTMNSTVDTALVARTKTTGVTGQSGYVDLILIRSDAFSFGGAYRVNVSDANGTKLYSRYVRVPNVSSCFADDLIAV